MGISLAALASGLVAIGMGLVLMFGPDGVRIEHQPDVDGTRLAVDATAAAGMTVPAATATTGSSPGDASAPPIRVVGDTPLPADALLVTTTGGYGHGTGLPWRVRLIQGTDAEARVQTISIPGAPEGTIMGIVADPNGVLFTGVCGDAECNTEGQVDSGATTFFRSDHGGASWLRLNSRPGRWWIRLGVDGDAVAINFDGAQPAAVYVGSNRAITRDEAWDGLVSYRGSAAWISREFPMLVDERGASLLKFDVRVDGKVTGYWDSAGAQSAVLWHVESPNPATNGFDTRNFISTMFGGVERFRTFETNGAITRVVSRWNNDILLVEAEVAARPNTCGNDYAAGGDHGISPALFNAVTGHLSFFSSPFFPEGCAEGAERVVMLVRGTFVRVNTPGDCLNLRESPAPDAEPLTCVVHGAVVNASAGNVTEAAGIRWARVITLSGQDGWVAEEFLSR